MKSKTLIIFFVALIFVIFYFTISELAGSGGKSFTVWAKPLEFGNTWEVIESHGGVVHFKITASPEKKVTIIGEVKYCGSKEEEVTEKFSEEIKFTTGDCWSNIEVRFMCSSSTATRVFGWIGPQ